MNGNVKKTKEKSVNTSADVWICQILSLNDTCNIQMLCMP